MNGFPIPEYILEIISEILQRRKKKKKQRTVYIIQILKTNKEDIHK